jgi:hypothetical protein
VAPLAADISGAVVVAALPNLKLLLMGILVGRDGGRSLLREVLVVDRQPNEGDRDISRRSSECHCAEVTRPPQMLHGGRGRC